jgi:hypothetical protein
LKNQYLKNLREGILAEKQAKEQENRGELGLWWPCFTNYLNCEFIDKMSEISPRIDWERYRREFWTTELHADFAALFSCLALSAAIEAKEWIDRINHSMERYSVESIRVEGTAQKTVRLTFAFSDGSTLAPSQLARFLSEVLHSMTQKPPPAKEEPRRKINLVATRISTLMDYLRTWKDQGIPIEEYIQLRQDNYKASVDLLTTQLSTPKEEKPFRFETSGNTIREIEQKELQKIFGGQSFRLDLGNVN